jgi:GNAT superfamily N-acetyltransferase
MQPGRPTSDSPLWTGRRRGRARAKPRIGTSLPEFQAYRGAKAPHVRFWLAYADLEPVAYFSSWPGVAGVGMVEDLFTRREYRHRGIATALIAHCVAEARSRGAREVMIGADPTDTPMRMYAAMGFRPLMVTANYFRSTEA